MSDCARTDRDGDKNVKRPASTEEVLDASPLGKRARSGEPPRGVDSCQMEQVRVSVVSGTNTNPSCDSVRAITDNEDSAGEAVQSKGLHPVPVTALDVVEALAAASAQHDLGPMFNFKTGKRVEVKWILESETDEDEGNQEQEVWWPGVVLDPTGREHALDDDVGETAPASVPIYEIKYDARPPEFPEPSTSDVALIGPHELLDVETDTIQVWRFEGDTWDTADDNDDSASAVQRAETHMISSQALEAVLGALNPTDIERVKEILQKHNLMGNSASDSNPDEGGFVAVPEGRHEETAQTIVDSILEGILENNKATFEKLPHDMKCSIVDDIKAVKTLLKDKIKLCFDKKRTLDGAAASEIVSEMYEEIQRVKRSRG
mmetsp:Transcript_17230/g.31638  ORF Transcript_17230/g.31638 Transcript_17230/m.31638 type:complete len:376 (+) Transcript_17230:203-1330(+)